MEHIHPVILPEGDRKAICVVGAGPVGLAAIKTVLDAPQYKAGCWKVTAFEARDDVGGVWLPAPPTEEPPLTPLYDSLTTNIPHPIMAYTDFPFPPSTPLFPRASVVLQYLKHYADHNQLRSHICFRTTVTSIKWNGFIWEVNLSTGATDYFDLVFVCNGHYRMPRYPDTLGLSQWLSSGFAIHSAYYRNPQSMGTGISPSDNVLVLGAGPSGTDIATELLAVAGTVIRSITGATPMDSGNLRIRPRISHFHSVDDTSGIGAVTFVDGTAISGITRCILATGYEYSYPFLSSDILHPEFPPPVPPIPTAVYNSTYHLFPLARHIFPLQSAFPPQTIAFLGLLWRVVPFPLAEAQALAVLHAFTHPNSLDPTRESVDIVTRHERLRSEFNEDKRSIARAWHMFQPLEQYDYRDELGDLIVNSLPPTAGESASNLDVIWEWRTSKPALKVPWWERKIYARKNELRMAWVMLEQRGEAEEWVNNVGSGQNPTEEWVSLMERVLRWAELNLLEVDKKDGEVDKSKL